MLSATSQSKHAARYVAQLDHHIVLDQNILIVFLYCRFLRLAMASIMDILKIKPFVEVSVGQLLWGYEDPLLKLAKDVVPKEQKLPYEEFGVMYGKNSTSPVNKNNHQIQANTICTRYTRASVCRSAIWPNEWWLISRPIRAPSITCTCAASNAATMDSHSTKQLAFNYQKNAYYTVHTADSITSAPCAASAKCKSTESSKIETHLSSLPM